MFSTISPGTERANIIGDLHVNASKQAEAEVKFPRTAGYKTRLEVSESLMVLGLGLVGQLTVQLARAVGAVPVIAVDPVKERLEAE